MVKTGRKFCTSRNGPRDVTREKSQKTSTAILERHLVRWTSRGRSSAARSLHKTSDANVDSNQVHLLHCPSNTSECHLSRCFPNWYQLQTAKTLIWQAYTIPRPSPSILSSKNTIQEQDLQVQREIPDASKGSQLLNMTHQQEKLSQKLCWWWIVEGQCFFDHYVERLVFETWHPSQICPNPFNVWKASTLEFDNLPRCSRDAPP